MARIILGSYMVRYPLGGMLSGPLQWLVGLARLGHDVFLVEKSGYANSCYDPVQDAMSDDCAYGVATVNALLARFDLHDKWCFADAAGRYHGLSRQGITDVFKSADLFIDMGTHGSWLDEAAASGLRALIDGEPGYTQMKMEKRLALGDTPASYDYYYTVGCNIGTARSSAPSAGKQWRHVFHPVAVELFRTEPPNPGAAFTTVMNWQAHEPLEFEGRTYGQKDVEFARFMDLPTLVRATLEVAVSGRNVPVSKLRESGWQLRDAHQVTMSVDSFTEYVRNSMGEFSVCKNVFTATNSGWFSERSAAYLASGRPVVVQDTGLGGQLPSGAGLFTFRTVAEAAAAIDEVRADYERHSKSAREVACEFLDAPRVLGKFLRELGI